MKYEFGVFKFEKIVKNKGGCQCSMPAKIYFSKRREPTNVVFFHTGLNKKNRFTEIIFKSQSLHQIILNPVFQRNNSSRIASEYFIRKGVNLVKGKFHCQKSIVKFKYKKLLFTIHNSPFTQLFLL